MKIRLNTALGDVNGRDTMSGFIFNSYVTLVANKYTIQYNYYDVAGYNINSTTNKLKFDSVYLLLEFGCFKS